MQARWMIVPFAALLVACNDDKPKQQSKGPASAEPIPSDLVYNSFFDDKTAASKIVLVTDAGSDAGAAALASGSTAKLVDPGGDPKTPLVYAFSTKVRTVTASIKMVQTQGAGSQEQTFKYTFMATPKPKFGLQGASTVDIKVTKLELTLPSNAPPQAASAKDQIEKALVGVSGHFDATSHGDIDNLDFESDHIPQGAGELVSVMEQALEFLVLPLPNEAVGVGAKWTKTESKRLADQGATVATTVNITLQSRDATTATLKVDAQNSGTMAVNDPRAPKGTSVQRSTAASYTVVIRFDGISQKVDGEANTNVTQKVPGQADVGVRVKITQNLTSQ
jgi:hypothetical protein